MLRAGRAGWLGRQALGLKGPSDRGPAGRGNGHFPTFVDLHFFNEAEVLLSTSHEFICGTEVRLTAIDPNLDQFFGSKALLETTEAEKVAIFGVDDHAGPVTLIGLVETLELSRAGDRFVSTATGCSTTAPGPDHLRGEFGIDVVLIVPGTASPGALHAVALSIMMA